MKSSSPIVVAHRSPPPGMIQYQEKQTKYILHWWPESKTNKNQQKK